MASEEANEWWTKLGELAHYHVEKDAAMAGFDAGREPLLAENRKLKDSLRWALSRVERDPERDSEEEYYREYGIAYEQCKREPSTPPAPGSGEREKG